MNDIRKIDWVQFPESRERDAEILRSGVHGQLQWYEQNLGDHGETIVQAETHRSRADQCQRVNVRSGFTGGKISF